MNYPVIIIFEEHHCNRYFIAKDPDEIGRIALKVLAERLEDGYWYEDDEDMRLSQQAAWDKYKKAIQKLTPDEIIDLNIQKPQFKEPPALEEINDPKRSYLKMKWHPKTFAQEIIAKKDGKAAFRFLDDQESLTCEFPEEI